MRNKLVLLSFLILSADQASAGVAGANPGNREQQMENQRQRERERQGRLAQQVANSLTDPQEKAFMEASRLLAGARRDDIHQKRVENAQADARQKKKKIPSPDSIPKATLEGDSDKLRADNRENSTERLGQYASFFFGMAPISGLTPSENGHIQNLKKAQKLSYIAHRRYGTQLPASSRSSISAWLRIGDDIFASLPTTEDTQLLNGIRAYMRAYILILNINKISTPLQEPRPLVMGENPAVGDGG